MNIQLITDSACDLPLEYVDAKNIKIASLEVNIDGAFHKDDLGKTLKHEAFYKKLREGTLTSTSQVNVHTFEALFEEAIEAGKSVIYIGLASVLSGTVNSALMARNSILEKYPDAQIDVIDSKSATLGEGLLVQRAQEMIEQGCTQTEIVDWVVSHREKVIHSIVLEDLSFLKRGGRISGATSVVGTLLNIKPTIKLDNEGRVIQGTKLKGSKSVMRFFINELKEKAVDLENSTIYIAHGDALESALKLKEHIQSECTVKEIIISPVGGVIGTHVGPDAMAVLFMGTER